MTVHRRDALVLSEDPISLTIYHHVILPETLIAPGIGSPVAKMLNRLLL